MTEQTIDVVEEINNEIRTAYADSGPQRADPAYVNDVRCLSFLASGWLTADYAADAVELVGQYNAFKPDTVAEMIEAIESADPDALFAIGRESSPVIYVETDRPGAVIDVFNGDWVNDEETRAFADGTPDELSEVDTVSNYRKDWYADSDEHSMCRHESPPVDVEDFAAPDPDRQHVRAWWD